MYGEAMEKNVDSSREYGKTGCFVVPCAPNPRHHKGWRSLGRSNTPDLILRTVEENITAIISFVSQLDWFNEYIPNPLETSGAGILLVNSC